MVSTNPTPAPVLPSVPPTPVDVAEKKPAEAPKQDEQAAPEKVAAADPPPPAPPPESLERILLLTPGGPLVIEFSLILDGQPFDANLSRLAAEVLAAADIDGDGRATWKEVLASPKFKYGQFGNNPITAETTLKSLVESYDSNRDGLLNAMEVPKFLTKNMAGLRAFSLRTSNQIPGDNVVESPLRRWLDEDEDGALSAEEIAAAPVRMLARDADDDGLLVPAEFSAPEAALMPGEIPQTRKVRRFGSESAHLIGPKAKWNSVLVALEEQYGVDGANRDNSFPQAPGLFERLDVDQNRVLDKQEITALLTTEPQLKLLVEFGREGKKPPTARLSLQSIAPDLAESVKVMVADESRLAIALPGATLDIYCRDAAPAADYETQAQTLLAMYDGDKNGYLEKQELPEENPTATSTFESFDADGDGKVYLADIAAQLERQQTALHSQIQVRAGEQEDALFAALDTNGDGRLSAREISAASTRLAALDADQDGTLSVNEVPGSLAVGLVRGEVQTEITGLIAPPLAARPRSADVPIWFARMDGNDDGEISPREFLGTLEKFQSLDANNDGLLSLEELLPVPPPGAENP